MPHFKIIFIFSVMLGMLCLICDVRAQSQSNGQDFFDKNFAENPLASTSAPKVEEAIKATTTVAGSASVNPKEDSNFIELGATPTQTIDPNSQQAFGTRVYAIGAIINAHDQKHFRENINQLLNVCRDRDIAIARIYAIANPFQYNETIKPFLTNDWRLLTTLQFINRVAVLSKPPVEFQATHSPTWLFATDKGIIEAEGYKNLNALFAQNGMLKDLAAEPEVTPVPTSAPIVDPSPLAQP